MPRAIFKLLIEKSRSDFIKSVWPKYKVPIILASLGALFHIIFVAYPLVASVLFDMGSEGLAMWLVIVDFPLVWLEDAAIKRWSLLNPSNVMRVFYFSFFGTIMYAICGWFVGWVVGGLLNQFLFRKDTKK